MDLRYEVFSSSVSRVVDFYVDVLGFRVSTDRRETSPEYAVVTRGNVWVGCSEMSGGHGADRRPPHGSEIVLTVADVREAYDRVVESGWPVADELTEREWGATDFRVFDPTGQYLRITG